MLSRPPIRKTVRAICLAAALVIFCWRPSLHAFNEGRVAGALGLRTFLQDGKQSNAPAIPLVQSNQSTPMMSPGVAILTPTDGVDFHAYANRLVAAVKRNWYALMPEPALHGEKGVVVLTFRIRQDGTLVSPDPTLERTSRKEALDKAAMIAVFNSAPFDPLPADFHGPEIKLRCIFFYNLPVAMTDDLAHPPDPQNTHPARQLVVEITKPTRSGTLGDYSLDVSARVSRSWNAVMPESALLGEKGSVTVKFHIKQDGAILGDEPRVESGSGKEALDKAALDAIRNSVPFAHLPAGFHGSKIQLRCTFKYLGIGDLPKGTRYDPSPDGVPRIITPS